MAHDDQLAERIRALVGVAPDITEKRMFGGLGSSLTYGPASGRYHYVWKTDRAWAETCRRLVSASTTEAVSQRTSGFGRGTYGDARERDR